jgi:ferric-dicitrate binding protein FerR (iron transport regulator)
MDILATFPAVKLPGTVALRQESAPCGTSGLRRSRSITFLAAVAACLWATVWWLERERSATQEGAASAVADGSAGKAVAR